MVGRSLLQQGAVTTFGLASTVRMVAVDDAGAALRATVDDLPVQLGGGAVGTLAPGGVPLLERFAAGRYEDRLGRGDDCEPVLERCSSKLSAWRRCRSARRRTSASSPQARAAESRLYIPDPVG